MKNQVPQFFFNFAAGDLVLVSSYEVADILFCDSLAISEAISDYGAQAFALHSPRVSLPLVTCSSPHKTSKEEDILHPLGHLLLRVGDDFNTHGLFLKVEIYNILWFSSHGSNYQELFLSLQLISAALQGSSFHRANVYISDSVEYIILLPKRKIPIEIMMKNLKI